MITRFEGTPADYDFMTRLAAGTTPKPTSDEVEDTPESDYEEVNTERLAENPIPEALWNEIVRTA